MPKTPGTALITGASSGIGEAFARRLALDGYDLILHGRRMERLRQLKEELERKEGIRARTVRAELSRPEEVGILEELIQSTSDLSLLINNAGFSTRGFFQDEAIEGQEALVAVHILVPLRLTHAALPIFQRRGGGAIINVASLAGFLIGPGSATYCATKASLINFTETLHLELAGSGITVQALCPGFTISDFHRRLGYDTGGSFFRGFMPAQKVVETSLRDLKRGKVISIPGLANKLVARGPHLVPRRFLYFLVPLVQKYQRHRNGTPL